MGILYETTNEPQKCLLNLWKKMFDIFFKKVAEQNSNCFSKFSLFKFFKFFFEEQKKVLFLRYVQSFFAPSCSTLLFKVLLHLLYKTRLYNLLSQRTKNYFCIKTHRPLVHVRKSYICLKSYIDGSHSVDRIICSLVIPIM